MSAASPATISVPTKLSKARRYTLFNFHHDELLDSVRNWLAISPEQPMLLSGESGVGRGFALRAASFGQQLDNKGFQVISLDVNLMDQPADYIINNLEKKHQDNELRQSLWHELKAYIKDAQIQNDSANLGYSIVLQLGMFVNLAELMLDRIRHLDSHEIELPIEEYLSDLLRVACNKQHIILHIDHATANIHSTLLFLRIARQLNAEAADQRLAGRCLLAINNEQDQTAEFANTLRLDRGEYKHLRFAPLRISDLQAVLPQRGIYLSDHDLKLLMTYGDPEQHFIYPDMLETQFLKLQKAGLLVETDEGYFIDENATESAVLGCIGLPLKSIYEAGINPIEDPALRRDVKQYMQLAALCGEHYVPQVQLLACMGIDYHSDEQAQARGDAIIDIIEANFIDSSPALLSEHFGIMSDAQRAPIYSYTFNYPILAAHLTTQWGAEEKAERSAQVLEQLAKLLPHANHARNSLFWHLALTAGGETQQQWFVELYHHVMGPYLLAYQQELQEQIKSGKTNALVVLRHVMKQRHYPAYYDYLRVTAEACHSAIHPDGSSAINFSELQALFGEFEKQAEYFYERSRYSTALGLLRRLEILAERMELDNKLAMVYYLQGINELHLGNYDTALSVFEKVLTIQEVLAEKLEVNSDEDELKGATLNSLSQIYDARGDYETALNYLQQSLAIQQEIGDKSGEGATLNNLSQIYDARGDYETALDYLQQSLAIAQEIGDKSGEGISLKNLSKIFITKGDYDTAINYLGQARILQQEIGDQPGLSKTLLVEAEMHIQKKNMQVAIASSIEAYNIAKEIGYAETLTALEKLAPQLGLEGGLAGWEALAQQMHPD